jgi:eukaryotic-like serine/threonine-protein kinase
MSPGTQAPPTPATIGQFEIVRRLGAGGMAEVFLAKKRGAEGTYKLLVVKRVLPHHGQSRRFRAMFVAEAQLATRLNHPNIVQVYDFQDIGDEAQLLSMEYVEGTDLGRVMSAARGKGARLPPWVAGYIIGEAAKGLHYAHERKDEAGVPLAIVHRDVSPQNILISFDGGVKIADFGIASANLFREEGGVLKGKFGYMSPEQARGDHVDRRSDIYSLGVCLHEMLTGRFLHGGLIGDDLLEAVRGGELEPPSTYVRDVPPDLEVVVMRALARNREDRFQTARDMAGAVTRAMLAHQELVDAVAVEAVIMQLVGREHTSPGTSEPSVAGSSAFELQPFVSGGTREGGTRDGGTREGGTRDGGTREGTSDGTSGGARGAEEGRRGSPSEAPQLTMAAAPRARQASSAGADSQNTPRERRLVQRGTREVRHVAMVMLRISGMAELEQIMGRHKGDYAAEQIKRTLDDIAYKRGAEWSWEPGFGAKAVVGLLANSSRAAADAAWLAVDVHDALAAASEDIDVAIQASVAIVRGIASGERDRDGRLVRHALMPPAEYLAELLGQRAQLGSTWVAGGLYRMVRRDFLWGDAPTIDIEPQPGRVLPRVMRVYALERPLSREERVAEMALAPSDLVGRDAEKADLHAAYHRAVAPDGGPGAISGSSGQHGPASGGPSGAIVARAVVGEMGIGKTALVATFQGELPPDTRIIRIEASPVRIELPFGAMGDLVRDALSLEPDQPAEAVAAALEALLGPLAKGPQGEVAVGRLTELVTGQLLAVSDEEDLNYRRKLISTGIRRLLAALASRQPLVIVCDGLQWVDKQSLELISELVRRSDPLPILALMVTRPEERILPYLEGIVRIDLRGLSHDDQLRLVENRLGVREGVAGVCADLIPRVAGNPFFLLEMIDALLERGALELQQNERGEAVLARVEQERDGHGPPLPSTLEQIIGDRLRELPPHEHAVVDWLAVANGPLSLGDLAALGGSDGRAAPGEAGGSDPASDAREAVMRLCARGVCDQRGDAVDFRHTIARDVAYMAIDTPTRRRMHRRLGEHLASTPTAKGLSAAIVARHLSKGEAHEQAAELYLTAGHAARAGYQTQLATRYYQRALHLLPPGDPRRLLGHEALEAIYRVLGRRRERKAHLAALRQLSRELKHPRWVALALARSARLDLDEGHLTHGLPMAQRAAEVARAARAPSVEVEAESITSELLRDLGDTQGALAACDAALRVAGAHPEVPARTRAEVLRARGAILRRLGRVSEAVDAYAEAIAVFRRCGARRQEARAKNALAMAMLVSERWEDAIALALASISIDLAIGGRFQIAKTLTNIGQAYARIGDAPRAHAYLRRAREAHERYSDQDSHADTLLVSAEVMLLSGDLDAAHTFCTDAGALTAVTGSKYDAVHERIVRALLAQAQSDPAQALAHAFEARQQSESFAFASFHLYATAIEAASRVEAGETLTGVLLASTAMGTVDSVPTEYGAEVRALACTALEQARSPRARDATIRADAHLRSVGEGIRDMRLRKLFFERAEVKGLHHAAELYLAVPASPASGPFSPPSSPGPPSPAPSSPRPSSPSSPLSPPSVLPAEGGDDSLPGGSPSGRART